MSDVEEALAALREGERLLDDLPPGDPDQANVRLAVAILQDLYQQLSGAGDDPYDVRGHMGNETVRAASELIGAVEERLRRKGRSGRS